MIWNTSLITEALGIAVDFKFEATGLEFNSKDVKSGDIFIALKGATGDGHNYIKNALNNGAVAVIAERNPENLNNVIIVTSTLDALHKLSQFKRENVKAQYIGVTGSVGKTSTKEMLAAFFQAYGKTAKTEGNFNNDLGVPITLARMPMDAEYAIIEMGMSAKGEIENLTKLVDPKLCIITCVEPVHLEFFENIDAIADAKSEIFMGKDSQRIAIINIDNSCASRLIDNAKKYGVKIIRTFGKNCDAGAVLKDFRIEDENMSIVVELNNHSYKYKLPVIGEHHAINSMISLLAADSLGLDPNVGLENLNKMKIAKGRGEILDININGKKITLVNEAYNSSPAALKAVLKAYSAKYPTRRKLAILGDMKELGKDAHKFHSDIAQDITENNIEGVICVGELMKYLFDTLPNEKNLGYFINVDEIFDSNILNHINDGDVLILKASNSMKLYKIADYLKNFS